MGTSESNLNFTTPVLFIVFNRPQTTRQVFQAIRAARPSRLYIAADGPRENIPQDVANCRQVREIVQEVDWDCEVKTLFRDGNLNCGVGPSSAINWFFEQEEEGIILEDDCVPSQSFFPYCQQLLERYRHDRRIMHIGGNNFLEGESDGKKYDYYFSLNGHIWGWATWRRAWQYFDFNISGYEQLKRKGYFSHFFVNSLEKIYRLRKFNQTVAKRGRVDWWDYQWDFARFSQNGLSVVPARNLVRNIGFGNQATHTVNADSARSAMKADELHFPLRHPELIMRDIASDKQYMKKFFRNKVAGKIQKLVKI